MLEFNRWRAGERDRMMRIKEKERKSTVWKAYRRLSWRRAFPGITSVEKVCKSEQSKEYLLAFFFLFLPVLRIKSKASCVPENVLLPSLFLAPDTFPEDKSLM